MKSEDIYKLLNPLKTGTFSSNSVWSNRDSYDTIRKWLEDTQPEVIKQLEECL